jgi:hypothetical protein
MTRHKGEILTGSVDGVVTEQRTDEPQVDRSDDGGDLRGNGGSEVVTT